MAELGIVINVDTRPGYLDEKAFCGMATGGGCRAVDFFTDNVRNKIRFFRGYDTEVTLLVDVHEDIHPELMAELSGMYYAGEIQNLVLCRTSRDFMGKPLRQWHDTMYLNAMMLSRAKYIAHFDGDSGAYRRDDCDIIEQWIQMIEEGKYKFISYPTAYSPNEGDIPGQNAIPPGEKGGFDYLWASTRFFFCRRDILNYNEIVRCFDDHYWISEHGGRPHRYPNVMEQILGFLAGPGQVCYSPKNNEQYMIFSWHEYHKGAIKKLALKNYDEIYSFIMNDCGGINGACDVCMGGPF